MGNHTNALNTLEQIKRETKDDARLYACIRDLYEQGVSLSDLKALIPDIRRTREQLQLKRMLQNNNEVLLNMFSQEMTFLLDAKERQEELEFKKLDQLIRQGKTVIMATQVPQEGSDLSVYQVGKHVKERYRLLETYDMTLEATVTKLMWAMGQSQDPQEIRRLFCATVNYDMLF